MSKQVHHGGANGSAGLQASSRMLVVAIDLGTTYSGYAYSFQSDFNENPLKMCSQNFTIEETVERQGITSLLGRRSSVKQTEKVPTTVLYNQQREFHSFGFKAEDKYASLCSEGKAKGWYYFEKFKMKLHCNKTLHRDMLLSDFTQEKFMPAIDVFADVIRFMKQHMTNLLSKRSIKIRQEDISWVLAVPAIWDDQARQFMREAAVKAGIPKQQLFLALEPEVAVVYWQYWKESGDRSDRDLRMEPMSAPNEERSSLLQTGKQFMVVDCGGETIDITVYEVLLDKTLKELNKSTKGDWGGTKIDEAFKQFLRETVGFDVLAGFNRLDLVTLYRELEKAKCLNTDHEEVTLKLPHSIKKALDKIDLEKKTGGRVRIVQDCLEINKDLMGAFFDQPKQSIVKDIKSMVNRIQGISTILLVGGFSESRLIQDAVKAAFPNLQVFVPVSPAAAVLKGAVLCRHDSTVNGWNASPYTYGVSSSADFQRDKHDANDVAKMEMGRQVKKRSSWKKRIPRIRRLHKKRGGRKQRTTVNSQLREGIDLGKEREESLKTVNSQLREEIHLGKEREESLKDQLRKAENKIRSLENKNQELLQRLSAIASERIRTDNPRVEDLSDKSRPTEIARAWKSVFGSDYWQAYSALRDLNLTDEDVATKLFAVAQQAYVTGEKIASHLEKVFEDAIESNPSLLSSLRAARTTDISTRKLLQPVLECLRSQILSITDKDFHTLSTAFAKAILQYYFSDQSDVPKFLCQVFRDNFINTKFSPQILQDYKTKVTAMVGDGGFDWKGCQKFAEQVLSICFLMVMQNPPLTLYFDHKLGEEIDSRLFDLETPPNTSGPVLLDYVLCPPLLRHLGGPVLCKGLAVPKI